jgi:hypothetical protein
VAEEARLESVCTPKAYRGFESLSLRKTQKRNWRRVHSSAISFFCVLHRPAAGGEGCANVVSKSRRERYIFSEMCERSEQIPERGILERIYRSKATKSQREGFSNGFVGAKRRNPGERDSRTDLSERSDEIPRKGNHFNLLYSSQLTLLLLFFQEQNYDVHCEIHILTDCSHI